MRVVKQPRPWRPSWKGRLAVVSVGSGPRLFQTPGGRGGDITREHSPPVPAAGLGFFPRGPSLEWWAKQGEFQCLSWPVFQSKRPFS